MLPMKRIKELKKQLGGKYFFYRPLSSDNEALRRRHNERYERYCATCDVRIPNGGTPDEAIAAIRKDFFHEALDH